MNPPRLFSVIVPSHRRVEPLRACLASLLASDFPADRFEVVVVDDGNDERIEAAAAHEFDPTRVTWVRLDANRGPAAARNAGAARARGDYLSFIDDDCLAPLSWLIALDQAIAASPDAAVGGPLEDAGSAATPCRNRPRSRTRAAPAPRARSGAWP